MVSLKKSLRVLFFVLFLIPVISLSLIFIYFLYDTMLDREMKNVQTSLAQTELIFNNTLRQVRNLSDRIYISKPLQNVMLKKYDDIQQVYSDYSKLDYLESYLHSSAETGSFRIYTHNQTLLDNQFIIKVTPNIMAEDWYERARRIKGQPFWIYKQDSISKKYYLSLIRSLWSSSNGEFVGVLVINVNPIPIQNNLSNLIYQTAILFDNEVLYTSDETITDSDKLLLIKNAKNPSFLSKMQRITFHGERVGIFTEMFSPENTVGLSFFISYIIPIKQLYNSIYFILLVSLLVIIILILLSYFVIAIYSNYINERVKKVQKGISNVIENNFEISSSIGGNDEFSQIYENLYEMSGNIKNLIDKVYTQNLEKEQLAARQSEISFKMLSAQINPHFLFNTLETIRMKSITRGEKEVATMLKLLASLLRYNLTVKGKPVPLIDEINAIQNYLNIQHMRFGERISYDVVTLCDIQHLSILPLLIQPIVENSFTHGLESKESGGFIYIFVNYEEEANQKVLTISVKDNGCGISEEKLAEIRKNLAVQGGGILVEKNSNSIGMYNVNERIKLFYGEKSGISIESKVGEGTTVFLKIYQ